MRHRCVHIWSLAQSETNTLAKGILNIDYKLNVKHPCNHSEQMSSDLCDTTSVLTFYHDISDLQYELFEYVIPCSLH